MSHKIKIKLLAFLGCLLPLMAYGVPAKTTINSLANNQSVSTDYPQGQKLYDRYPNSFLYYYGITGSDPFIRIARGEFHRWPEHIQSVEFAHTLSEENIVRRFFSPLVGVVQLAGVGTVRTGSNENT